MSLLVIWASFGASEKLAAVHIYLCWIVHLAQSWAGWPACHHLAACCSLSRSLQICGREGEHRWLSPHRSSGPEQGGWAGPCWRPGLHGWASPPWVHRSCRSCMGGHRGPRRWESRRRPPCHQSPAAGTREKGGGGNLCLLPQSPQLESLPKLPSPDHWSIDKIAVWMSISYMYLGKQEGSGDHIFGLTVCQLAANFMRGVDWVEGGHHQTSLRCSQESDHIIRTVWHHYCHDIAFVGSKAQETTSKSSCQGSGLWEGQLGTCGPINESSLRAKLCLSAPAHGREGYWRNCHLKKVSRIRLGWKNKCMWCVL